MKLENICVPGELTGCKMNDDFGCLAGHFFSNLIFRQADFECEECGATYCDGDLVSLAGDLKFYSALCHPTVLAALSKLVEHVDE